MWPRTDDVKAASGCDVKGHAFKTVTSAAPRSLKLCPAIRAPAISGVSVTKVGGEADELTPPHFCGRYLGEE